MGRISKGILGGFSGTVGTVVGGNWKGIDYMRSKATTRKPGTSTAQDVQRAKFSLVIKFNRSMKDLLEITFRDFASRMTGMNSAFSHTMKNAVTGIYPDLRLDYTQVLVARGNMPNAQAPSAVSSVAGAVAFSWTDNSGIGKAHPSDSTILVVYCEALNQTAFTVGGAIRSAGSGTISVPTFSGHEVQTWLTFMGYNGKEIATSLYTGKVTVL